jgi:hypothetical protein
LPAALIGHLLVRFKRLHAQQVADNRRVTLRAELHMIVGQYCRLQLSAALDVGSPHLPVARNVGSALWKPQDRVRRVVAEVLVQIVGGIGSIEILLELIDVRLGIRPRERR